MKVSSIDHLNPSVRDFDETVAWYVRDPTGWSIEVVLWKDDAVRFDAA